jgi:single-stranded-DNA-specific exonuclease
LAEAVKVRSLIAQLLLRRGIETPEEASRFLAPSLRNLSDPFLLTDMRVAVERITRARDAGEAVLAFGDYDVDGISAMALLIGGLQRFGVTRVTHGMPMRLTEGYGLNPERVEAAQRDGVTLIITVDNGMGAHEAARRARELGVDLIITDHHSADGAFPEAVAIVNPKREPADHPAAPLCGAGVAFKLCMALNGTPNDLDIAALGTVADIVPLVGENRVLVALGLRHMAKYARTGIAELASKAQVNIAEMTAEKIGFKLGPRINAAGRLDDPMVALRLLLSESPHEASHIAGLLDEANAERQRIERAILDECVDELDACFLPRQRSVVLSRRGWHAGVIGIVASRLVTEYSRPTILIAVDEEGVGRGSARSGPGFDMMAALNACGEHLERYGGHRSAAGLTVREDRIQAFREAFEAQALAQLGAEEIVPELNIDAIAAFTEIDGALLKTLERLEPFGHGNPAPLFCSMGVEIVPQSIRFLKEHHLRVSLRQGDKVFSAIGFFMAERYHQESWPRVVDVAYAPKLNTYMNETTIQLELRDLRPANN